MVWKQVCAFVLVAAVGAGVGMGARAYSRPPRLDPVEQAPRRGSGETLIEFFDPDCGYSRKLHAALAQELSRSTVTHVLVLVAAGRRKAMSLAQALCALDPVTVWDTALAWSRTRPPRVEELQLDSTRLERCAMLVDAGTRHLVDLPGIEGRRVTPVVRFRGQTYIGADSINDLRALGIAKGALE